MSQGKGTLTSLTSFSKTISEQIFESTCLSTLHFLKFPENSFEVLKLLENSVEVLKFPKNKLELIKIPEKKLESLKLQENRPVDGFVPLSIKKITSECVLPRLLKRNCNYERLMAIVKECCMFPVYGITYVEHHGYDVMADGEVEMEVVDKELDDEIEMEDVSEYVGLDHVGEEDVKILNTGLNDTFLNKLEDGKFISDKDFGAKLDIQSSSSRIVNDSYVDDRFKVKKGFPILFIIPICHGMRWHHC
ncbi:hypothetical protein Tco_0692290 [Tanacetum coccineum]